MPIHLSDPLLNLVPIIWLTHNTWPPPLSTPLLRRWTVSVPKHWLQDSWYSLPGSETNSPHNSAPVLHPRNSYIFHYFIICRNCTSQSQNLIINFCVVDSHPRIVSIHFSNDQLQYLHNAFCVYKQIMSLVLETIQLKFTWPCLLWALLKKMAPTAIAV